MDGWMESSPKQMHAASVSPEQPRLTLHGSERQPDTVMALIQPVIFCLVSFPVTLEGSLPAQFILTQLQKVSKKRLRRAASVCVCGGCCSNLSQQVKRHTW